MKNAFFVAIYQLVFDSDFLKICSPRPAFGNFIRSSGVLPSEYELGFLLNFAIILLLVRHLNTSLLFIALAILIIALFTTFHRLNWAIFVVCSSSYLFISKKVRAAFLLLLLFIGLSSIIAISYFAHPEPYYRLAEKYDSEAFVKSRFLQDTVTGRLRQIAITAEWISENTLGLGSYKTKEYYKLMAKHGMIHHGYIPLVVHNGYLAVGVAVGVKHGVPCQ